MDGDLTTEPKLATKRPGLAATLSALIPGSGQWYAGRLRRGLLIASPLLLLAAAVLFGAWGGVVGDLEAVVRPAVLWTLLGVNLVVLAWRVFAIGDAYRLAADGAGRWSRSWNTTASGSPPTAAKASAVGPCGAPPDCATRGTEVSGSLRDTKLGWSAAAWLIASEEPRSMASSTVN